MAAAAGWTFPSSPEVGEGGVSLWSAGKSSVADTTGLVGMLQLTGLILEVVAVLGRAVAAVRLALALFNTRFWLSARAEATTHFSDELVA